MRIVNKGADVPHQPTTIHSTIQLHHYGKKVDDVLYKLGGGQRLVLPTGEIFPLCIRNGLAYLSMCLPTDEEMNGGLPQCIFTSDQVWDPTIYTDKFTLEEQLKNLEDHPAGTDTAYNERGELILSTSFGNDINQSQSFTGSLPSKDDTADLPNNFHFVNSSSYMSENYQFQNSENSKILKLNAGSTWKFNQVMKPGFECTKKFKRWNQHGLWKHHS